MKQGYRDLDVWRKAMSMVKSVYILTRQFPKEELYGITSQIRRAAVSIPSNIAEGKARQGDKEFARFLCIARGSVAELETQLMISQDLGYSSLEKTETILEKVSEIGRMLNGLISTLNG